MKTIHSFSFLMKYATHQSQELPKKRQEPAVWFSVDSWFQRMQDPEKVGNSWETLVEKTNMEKEKLPEEELKEMTFSKNFWVMHSIKLSRIEEIVLIKKDSLLPLCWRKVGDQCQKTCEAHASNIQFLKQWWPVILQNYNLDGSPEDPDFQKKHLMLVLNGITEAWRLNFVERRRGFVFNHTCLLYTTITATIRGWCCYTTLLNSLYFPFLLFFNVLYFQLIT